MKKVTHVTEGVPQVGEKITTLCGERITYTGVLTKYACMGCLNILLEESRKADSVHYEIVGLLVDLGVLKQVSGDDEDR